MDLITCQHEWVRQCLAQYEHCRPEGYHWEDAHYPLPSRYGGETVRLWYPHHIVQGCLQTIDLNEPCIHGSKRHRERIIVEKEFPKYLHIFDQAVKVLQSYAGRRSPGRKDAGQQSLKEKTGIMSDEYRNSSGYLETRTINGNYAVEKKLGIHSEEYKSRPEYAQERRNSFALANSQRWVSLIDGFVSNAGGVAKHNRALGHDPYARRKLE